MNRVNRRSLKYTFVYVSAAEIFGLGNVTEDLVVQRLKSLSVYDCITVIGRVSAVLHWESRIDRKVQRDLVDAVLAPAPPLRDAVRKQVDGGRIAFFEQQLVHLARLALQHADPRPPEGFDAQRMGDLLFCLLGVGDVLGAEPLDVQDPDDRLRWTIVQSADNDDPDRLIQWGFAYEIFMERWPQIPESAKRPADEAFRRSTGLGIEEFLSVGFALSAGLGQPREREGPLGALSIEPYFGSTALAPDLVRKFLEATARTPEQFRTELDAEEAAWGYTTHRSLVQERYPLLRGPDPDTVTLISNVGLERRVTAGMLHILAEAGEQEGHDREHYTAPFGSVFEAWVADNFIRWTHLTDPQPKVFNNVPYGTRRRPRDTPDVVLRYPRQMIAVEVRGGVFNAKTITRGDRTTLDADLERLVFRKARQLYKRLEEIRAGDARHIGLDTDGLGRIWPVIALPADVPHWPSVIEHVRASLKREGVFKDKVYGTLGIVTAQDLVALERAVEGGDSLLNILRDWKSSAQTGDHSLLNYMTERYSEPGPALRSSHHDSKFETLARTVFSRTFGKEPPPDFQHRMRGEQ